MSPLGEAFRRAMEKRESARSSRPPVPDEPPAGAARRPFHARNTAAIAPPAVPSLPGPEGEAEAQVAAPPSPEAPPRADAYEFLSRARRVATFAEGPLPPGCDDLAGLRATLLALGLDRTPATILVAGAGCGEATAALAAGLAGEFARDLAYHVLLLDASVRRPRAAGILDVFPELDLADVLESRAEAADATVYSEGDNLSALVFRPDPLGGAARAKATAFLGERGREMLSELQGAFHYVVIDGGSVGESATPRVLASRATGTVLVLAAGVSRERARDARRAIETAGGRVLGAVFCL